MAAAENRARRWAGQPLKTPVVGPTAVYPITHLQTLWQYRGLVRNLVVRDLKLRYRSSFLGFGWSLLNPLLVIAVLTFVFSVIFPSRPLGVPFPAFLLPGVLAWNYLAAGLLAGMGSITGNVALVSKIYFPREVLPIAAVLAHGVNFLLAFPVMVAALIVLGMGVSWAYALLPVVLISQTLFVLGVAMILAGVNVYFRDTGVIMEVILFAWMFLTPIFYNLADVVKSRPPGDPTWLLGVFNPMAIYLSEYRQLLLAQPDPGPFFGVRGVAIGVGVFLIGYVMFTRLSRRFGDAL